jgi:hypothetical protein
MTKDEDYKDERYHNNFLKTKTFYDNHIPVHITKKNKEWLNGTISKITDDYFILEEHKKGRLMIFYIDLYEIEQLEDKI